MADNNFDGFFNINERGDGYYIEIFAPGTGGEAVTIKQVNEYMKEHKYENIKLTELEALMEKGEDNIICKVADKYIDNVYESEKLFRIEVSENRMKAYITFFPNADNTEYEIPIDEIKSDLSSRNIIFGVKEELIEELSTKHVIGEPYLVAEGQEAVEPIQGKVEYHFKTTKDFTPEIDEQGNVNFHKLSIVSNVKEGDLLASLVQTIAGKQGKNISGVEVSAKKGKPVRIRYGKNTKVNEDKTKLYAAKSGLVKIFDEKVVVNNVYEVPNHVGNSTGDIEFDGSVVVHGNVITGFTIKAKGDVEVMGVVEGATVISGGNIVLHSGIQGMGKSYVEAAGDIQTKFIEQANVSCGGDITSEAILHSIVSCKGTVKVEGKKGMISGGVVRSGVSVESRTLGSHMGTVTEIEVGIDPKMLEEYNELRKTLPKMQEEAEKLEKVIILLNKRKEMMGELESDKAEMYKSAVRNKVYLTNKITMNDRRINELQEEVDSRHSGTVRVAGVMYPGVKIGIGNIYYYVKEELKYVSMYKEGADIKLKPL